MFPGLDKFVYLTGSFLRLKQGTTSQAEYILPPCEPLSHPYFSSLLFPPQPTKSWPDYPTVRPHGVFCTLQLSSETGPGVSPKGRILRTQEVAFLLLRPGLEDAPACIPDVLLLRFQKVIYGDRTKGIVSEVVVTPPALIVSS
jgi:hypothetical protein